MIQTPQQHVQSQFIRSNTLHNGSRVGFPGMAVNYAVDYAVMDVRMAVIILLSIRRLLSDPNQTRTWHDQTRTWHDQTLDGNAMVCLFPQQLLVHVVVI